MEQIEKTISELVLRIVKQKKTDIEKLNPEDLLIDDLQFASLDLAQLVATMEIKFGLDPFAQGARMSEIKTLKDLCNVYLKGQA